MPVWLQIVSISLGGIATIGGGLAVVLSISHKRRTIDNRPYPCQAVLDLQEEVEKNKIDAEVTFEKHDKYLSKDRERLETLEKAEARMNAEIKNALSDIRETKETTQRILLLLIEGKN